MTEPNTPDPVLDAIHDTIRQFSARLDAIVAAPAGPDATPEQHAAAWRVYVERADAIRRVADSLRDAD